MKIEFPLKTILCQIDDSPSKPNVLYFLPIQIYMHDDCKMKNLKCIYHELILKEKYVIKIHAIVPSVFLLK